jgi:hypothetical protein
MLSVGYPTDFVEQRLPLSNVPQGQRPIVWASEGHEVFARGRERERLDLVLMSLRCGCEQVSEVAVWDGR